MFMIVYKDSTRLEYTFCVCVRTFMHIVLLHRKQFVVKFILRFTCFYIYPSECRPSMCIWAPLQDIAGYENNDLVVLALHLLNRYFSMESDLFEKATESQVSCCG